MTPGAGAPPRVRRVVADDGARLAVEVHEPAGGAAGAPLVVLLHAFPAARWLWAGVLPRLAAAGWRAAAPDLRGFGDSPLAGPAGAAYRAAPSLDRHADDVACLLDALGAGRAVVGGLSMGGYVALACWRRHPGRVRALVLADTRADADTPETRERRDALVALARARGGGAVADTQLEGALGRSTRAHAPGRVAEFRRLLGDPDAEGVAAALVAMRERPSSAARLGVVTVPTLVVGGTEDVLTPPRDLRALAAAVPGAAFVPVERAGHASAWEQPAAFADALLGFLAGLPVA